MADEAPDLNARVAARVRELRTARGLSLDSLATRSGVSRSMISLVERGESSPTAVLLEKLASALDVTLASLFDIPPSAEPPAGPLARRKEQPEWRDPGSGYVRRNVSPPGAPQPMRIVDVRFPAGARVAFDNAARDATEAPLHQQVWVLQGSMDVTVGDERHRLREGDCLAMRLDHPTVFHNPTRTSARYAVVIETETRRSR
jgi:transcriptional regulator with XRE-family HTH domain